MSIRLNLSPQELSYLYNGSGTVFMGIKHFWIKYVVPSPTNWYQTEALILDKQTKNIFLEHLGVIGTGLAGIGTMYALYKKNQKDLKRLDKEYDDYHKALVTQYQASKAQHIGTIRTRIEQRQQELKTINTEIQTTLFAIEALKSQKNAVEKENNKRLTDYGHQIEDDTKHAEKEKLEEEQKEKSKWEQTKQQYKRDIAQLRQTIKEKKKELNEYKNISQTMRKEQSWFQFLNPWATSPHPETAFWNMIQKKTGIDLRAKEAELQNVIDKDRKMLESSLQTAYNNLRNDQENLMRERATLDQEIEKEVHKQYEQRLRDFQQQNRDLMLQHSNYINAFENMRAQGTRLHDDLIGAYEYMNTWLRKLFLANPAFFYIYSDDMDKKMLSPSNIVDQLLDLDEYKEEIFTLQSKVFDMLARRYQLDPMYIHYFTQHKDNPVIKDMALTEAFLTKWNLLRDCRIREPLDTIIRENRTTPPVVVHDIPTPKSFPSTLRKRRV